MAFKGMDMVRPQWIRFNREQAKKVLEQLRNDRDAIVFSQDVTDVSWLGLPFYNDWRLYRLINYATMPTFSMTYLSNGEEYIALDGMANPIYTVNEKDPISLNEANVIPYLEFFFSNVQGSEGDVFIIKDPHKMPFMENLTPAQRQSIIKSFRPLIVIADAVHDGFKVTGTLHYGGGLIAASILVGNDGKISFHDQSLLLSGIHFPDSPYTQAWLEA
jgi:hypothetical protein